MWSNYLPCLNYFCNQPSFYSQSPEDVCVYYFYFLDLRIRQRFIRTITTVIPTITLIIHYYYLSHLIFVTIIHQYLSIVIFPYLIFRFQNTSKFFVLLPFFHHLFSTLFCENFYSKDLLIVKLRMCWCVVYNISSYCPLTKTVVETFACICFRFPLIALYSKILYWLPSCYKMVISHPYLRIRILLSILTTCIFFIEAGFSNLY